VAGRQRAKALEIVREAPGNAVRVADDSVSRDGRDELDVDRPSAIRRNAFDLGISDWGIFRLPH
jgi:hypothetical protein